MATRSRRARAEAVSREIDTLTVSRAHGLKALSHPMRLQVLSILGEGEELTNRELAGRLGVDPGHLHFHVRMLLRAGLIERVQGKQGREKPYRAVAQTIRVAPELLSSGLATDIQAAMLSEVQRGWSRFASEGQFRGTQVTVRLNPERVRELMQEFADAALALEDSSEEPLVVTLFSHPPTTV